MNFHDESSNEPIYFKNDSYFARESFNKSKIYNLEYRKKPAELVRKDLISAMKLPDYENLNRDDYILILDSWKEDWEKGVQIPVNSGALPRPILKKSTDHEKQTTKSKVFFNISDEKIKFQDTCEEVNYELDLQDICWLETLKKSSLNLDISEYFLEEVINEFEKECAFNLKISQDGIEFEDNAACAICYSLDPEDGNDMVFCNSCNMCVHAACYGIKKIPDGDWLCRPCKDLGSNKKDAICSLCPNVGGALKPTIKHNQWAHVACVEWIPEAKFMDVDSKEQVSLTEIPDWRKNLVCSICKVKKGVSIQCSHNGCENAYHITCAFEHALEGKMKVKYKISGQLLYKKTLCVKHSHPDFNNEKSNKNYMDYIVPLIINDDLKNLRKTDLCSEFWKDIDLKQINHKLCKKYSVQDRNETHHSDIVKTWLINSKSFFQIINLIYQYWKLKRISNYGNSLIKLTFAEKYEKQLNFHKSKINQFRFHLERLRTLSYMVCRREKTKFHWIENQRTIIKMTLDLLNNENSSKSEEINCKNKSLISDIIHRHFIYSKHFEINDTPINKVDSVSSSSQSINLRRKRPISEKSVISKLIQQVKRFKNLNNTEKNPYAKIYLNSNSKRKSDTPLTPDNKETKTTTQSNVNSLLCFKTRACISPQNKIKEPVQLSIDDINSFDPKQRNFESDSDSFENKKIVIKAKKDYFFRKFSDSIYLNTNISFEERLKKHSNNHQKENKLRVALSKDRFSESERPLANENFRINTLELNKNHDAEFLKKISSNKFIIKNFKSKNSRFNHKEYYFRR